MEELFKHGIAVQVFLGLYLAVLGMVCLYGLHRYHLVHLYYKYRQNLPKVQACFTDLPRVTIQLPMYNEQFVARRIAAHRRPGRQALAENGVALRPTHRQGSNLGAKMFFQ
jgi:hypothetical protein